MGYFGDIAESLVTAVKGMGVTFSHLRQKPNTVQWPHEPATTKPRTRAELFNNVDDCIGCACCAMPDRVRASLIRCPTSTATPPISSSLLYFVNLRCETLDVYAN